MAPGFTFVLVTLLSASSPRAIYSSALPVCDADGLTDEEAEAEERDAVEAERAVSLIAQPGAPLAAVEYARLCLAEAPGSGALPAAQVSCSDVRASLWVNRMNGSCQPVKSRPSGHVVLRAPRNDRNGNSLACSGPQCWREPIPLVSANPDDGGRQPVVAERTEFHLSLSSAFVFEAPLLMPRSPPGRRSERPPKA